MAQPRLARSRWFGAGIAVSALAIATALTGATTALSQPHHSAGKAAPRIATVALPCHLGGSKCLHIGYTHAWFGGKTIDLEYSHGFFCRKPPSSAAASRCEAGVGPTVMPPSGAVVSNMYVLVPRGFKAPGTLHCPKAGHCIDQPSTIDLSRIGGHAKAALPAHAIVIEDDESFQSTWWPLVIVKVKNLKAWNKIATAKSAEAMDACESAGNCSKEFATNAFIFFQVLGPGMSPHGPA
jgi:hypothetical protein